MGIVADGAKMLVIGKVLDTVSDMAGQLKCSKLFCHCAIPYGNYDENEKCQYCGHYIYKHK